MVAGVAALVVDDAGVAGLTGLVEAPVIELGDHLALVHLGIQAAVGVGAGVGGQLIGQLGKAILGFGTVFPLLQSGLGGLLLLGLAASSFS